MFGVSIKKLVMKATASKIAEAQKQYDEQVKGLQAKLEEDTVTLADSIVGNIVNK